MAWITVSSVDTRFCYTQLQYDDSSTGNNRSCRLIMASKSGSSVSSLSYWNVTVNGTNYGSVSGVDPGDIIWSGSLPAGNRSFSYNINWYDWGSTYYSGSGYIPTGVSIETKSVLLESYWNSIKVNSTVSTWGGYNQHRFESFILPGSGATTSNVLQRKRAMLRTVDSSSRQKDEVFTNAVIINGKNQVVLVTGLSGEPYLYRSNSWNGWSDNDQIKGCLDFQIGTFAYEDFGNWSLLGSDIPSTVYHTPPAPGTLTAPTTTSTADALISFKGVAESNHTPGDATKLTRTVRYHDANIQEWTYIDNHTQRTISSITTAIIPVIPGSSTIVEAWHTYYGLASEISTATITSALPPAANVALYGSVNGQTKKIKKLYGSVNGVTKKLKKVYASVGGETKLIFEDRT